MRILVYGAGVQGCELAHRLLQNKKNVVTLLARGEWKERIDQKGLVIRSMLQFRTTTDRVATIDTLAPDDCYDLVFVTMQAGQLPDVLPILKQNRSEYFVFVGNDPHAVEVMQAIRDMVTQSAGPYTAAAMGMALAAYECREKPAEEQLHFLQAADETISNARPTTYKRMKLVCDGCLEAAKLALREARPVDLAIREHAVNANNRRYSKVNEIARYLVPLIPDGGTVMTQCFGETIVGMMLKEARQAGKTFRLFCPETRPYFQGARLTATVCRDMGFDVTVITDNMPAFVMEREHVDLFTCAADAICLDGYVVNKVGTLQIAICANHFGIPTFVTGAPDIGHETKDTVKIEMRDPEFTLQAMGVRTAAQGVKGYYPAFDMTPPHLISGIVTDRGVFSPFDLHRYFAGGGAGEYDTVV